MNARVRLVPPLPLQVFRLHWPEEVRADEAKCQRSQTTGELLVTVPVARRGGPLQALHARRKQQEAAAGGGGGTTTAKPSAPPEARRRNVKLGEEVRISDGGAVFVGTSPAPSRLSAPRFASLIRE